MIKEISLEMLGMQYSFISNTTYDAAIRLTPSAIVTVVTATRPSGMTDTAKLCIQSYLKSISSSRNGPYSLYALITIPQSYVHHSLSLLFPGDTDNHDKNTKNNCDKNKVLSKSGELSLDGGLDFSLGAGIDSRTNFSNL